MKEGDTWTEIGTSTTGENGRVEGFDIEAKVATYRLAFELSNYADLGQTSFFPGNRRHLSGSGCRRGTPCPRSGQPIWILDLSGELMTRSSGAARP